MDIDKKNKTILIRAFVSKGTYIRTLCKDIAEKLDTIGFMNKLERIKVRRIWDKRFCNNRRIRKKQK